MEGDIDAGDASVIQIVSTGEALQERRRAEIPADEWTDVSVDITPREYVLDYLQHSFPVQLYEPCEDNEGSLSSRPVRDDDGNPVINREAVRRRDAMIERRSEEHTSELQSLMRISYAVFCLKKKKTI